MKKKRIKATNVPNLRFPEFEGEWEIKPIDGCIDLLSGFAFKGEDITEINSGIPLLRGINITEGSIRHSTEIDRYYLGNITKLDKYFLKEDDLVIGMDGSKVGKNAALITKSDENSLLIQRVARLRANKNSDIRFIYQHIISNQFHKYVDVVNTSSGIPHISAQQIKDFTIGFPSKSEQIKIATLLSLIDKRIQAQSKIIEELRLLKNTLSKKIFAQQLRFKDEKGNTFPSWEMKKLGDCLNYIQPTKYLVSSTEYDDSYKTPVLTAGKTFVLGYTNEEHGIFTDDLPVIIFDDFTTATQFVNFHFKAKSSAMKILVAKENADIKFVYESMQIMNYEIGGHERHWISKFALLEVSVPSFQEQQKIANFLSCIDDKINTNENIYTSLIKQKQYLLANLFI